MLAVNGLHTCPAPRCRIQVRASMLTCGPHWKSLPKPLRDAVWRAWDDGEGAGTPAHVAACRAAIRYLRSADRWSRPPADCPNCYGEREWSGAGNEATCYQCGQSGPAGNKPAGDS